MNRLVRTLAGMVVVLGLAGWPQRRGADTPDARAELEEFADKLKLFPPHGIAANQPDTRDLPGDLREPYRKFLERIADRKYENEKVPGTFFCLKRFLAPFPSPG
jgi:hypothetical protein